MVENDVTEEGRQDKKRAGRQTCPDAGSAHLTHPLDSTLSSPPFLPNNQLPMPQPAQHSYTQQPTQAPHLPGAGM